MNNNQDNDKLLQERILPDFKMERYMKAVKKFNKVRKNIDLKYTSSDGIEKLKKDLQNGIITKKDYERNMEGLNAKRKLIKYENIVKDARANSNAKYADQQNLALAAIGTAAILYAGKRTLDKYRADDPSNNGEKTKEDDKKKGGKSESMNLIDEDLLMIMEDFNFELPYDELSEGLFFGHDTDNGPEESGNPYENLDVKSMQRTFDGQLRNEANKITPIIRKYLQEFPKLAKAAKFSRTNSVSGLILVSFDPKKLVDDTRKAEDTVPYMNKISEIASDVRSHLSDDIFYVTMERDGGYDDPITIEIGINIQKARKRLKSENLKEETVINIESMCYTDSINSVLCEMGVISENRNVIKNHKYDTITVCSISECKNFKSKAQSNEFVNSFNKLINEQCKLNVQDRHPNAKAHTMKTTIEYNKLTESYDIKLTPNMNEIRSLLSEYRK